jgi:hypothetical protein
MDIRQAVGIWPSCCLLVEISAITTKQEFLLRFRDQIEGAAYRDPTKTQAGRRLRSEEWREAGGETRPTRAENETGAVRPISGAVL